MAVRMVSSMAIGYQVKQSIVTNCDDFVDKLKIVIIKRRICSIC